MSLILRERTKKKKKKKHKKIETKTKRKNTKWKSNNNLTNKHKPIREYTLSIKHTKNHWHGYLFPKWTKVEWNLFTGQMADALF